MVFASVWNSSILPIEEKFLEKVEEPKKSEEQMKIEESLKPELDRKAGIFGYSSEEFNEMLRRVRNHLEKVEEPEKVREPEKVGEPEKVKEPEKVEEPQKDPPSLSRKARQDIIAINCNRQESARQESTIIVIC